MVIGITGTNGFIGSSLQQALNAAENRVIALSRHAQRPDERYFDLEKPLQAGLFSGIQVLIHCAFIHPTHHPNAAHLNYEGTKTLIAEAKASGVKKIIFFSTVSAHEEAMSVYGRTKYREESLFDLNTDTVLKCGLVIGDGGLFHALLQQVLKRRVIPVLEGGLQPMQTIAIDDVVQAVKNIISGDLRGKFILANRQQLTYKDVFRAVAGAWKRKPLFVPVPAFVLNVAAQLAGVMGISLPFNRENIAGLQALRYFDPESSLLQLSLQPMELEEKLRQMAEAS